MWGIYWKHISQPIDLWLIVRYEATRTTTRRDEKDILRGDPMMIFLGRRKKSHRLWEFFLSMGRRRSRRAVAVHLRIYLPCWLVSWLAPHHWVSVALHPSYSSSWSLASTRLVSSEIFLSLDRGGFICICRWDCNVTNNNKWGARRRFPRVDGWDGGRLNWWSRSISSSFVSQHRGLLSISQLGDKICSFKLCKWFRAETTSQTERQRDREVSI